jgi:hypothetical protein
MYVPQSQSGNAQGRHSGEMIDVIVYVRKRGGTEDDGGEATERFSLPTMRSQDRCRKMREVKYKLVCLLRLVSIVIWYLFERRKRVSRVGGVKVAHHRERRTKVNQLQY